jgi:hypothetical protein
MIDSKRLWSIRVDETHQRNALKVLDEHLRALDEPWAGGLRYKVGAKLAALCRPNVATGPAFAAHFGLPAPDGRWLHQYRLGDAAFADLQESLQGAGGLNAIGVGFRPGLFVLWASEWFRRCYRGGGQRWEDLATALGVSTDQTTLRSLTADGLRQWHREVIQAGSSREYLGSLAREGGFPTAAIEEGGRGWARELLGTIVARLLGDATANEARSLELAEAGRSRLPLLFRDDAFVQLCADLALAIVHLRREADPAAVAAGIPVLAWLQLNRPEWRGTLPLTTGEAAARALIDGLMAVQAVASGVVGVDRLLVRAIDGSWSEAVRVTLDGAIDSGTMRAIDSREGRLRAYGAGEMARTLPSELAMIEPPSDGESRWIAHANQRTKGVRPVPFATAIELDLRSGDQRVARIALPGGKPRRGQLLVAVLDAGTEDFPQALRVVGAGSGKYRATDIYLQTPLEWKVQLTANETAVPLGAGAGDTCLWRVQGGAFVTDGAGDRYRILCGQIDDVPARIELIGNHPSWAQVEGDIDLFLGGPIAQIKRDLGALFIRAIGASNWLPAPGRLPVGHYELGWRDNHVLLDRRRIAVLPPTAELTRSGSGVTVQYQLSGFEGVQLRPGADAPVSPSSDGVRWVSRKCGAQVYHFDAVMGWDGAPALPVSINYPCAAALAHWDGRVLPGRTQITLDDLSDLVAINDGRMQLVAEMSDPQTRARGEMSWEFIDELPMTSIASDLARLLLPASIDATVKLGMHDGIETYWHVRPFEVRLEWTGGGIVASHGVIAPDATLFGRALTAPANEISLGSYSLTRDSKHWPIALPDDLAGTWLVFLRAQGKVLSRPLLVFGPSCVPPAQTLLTRAMMFRPREGLDAALFTVLETACGANPEAEIVLAELLALISSLHGLPPATFRVLELLAGSPGVLARLAMLATHEQREAVLVLSDGLPFAWCTLPQTSWDDAQKTIFDRAFAQLSGLGDQGVRFAMEMLEASRNAIIAREPLLASVLLPIRSALPISEVAQVFLNRTRDGLRTRSSERYRRVLGDTLPDYFLRFSDDVLDTLDAPCAAALAVRGRWTPGGDDIRHIKTIAHTFPAFFADAFASTLKETA